MYNSKPRGAKIKKYIIPNHVAPSLAFVFHVIAFLLIILRIHTFRTRDTRVVKVIIVYQTRTQ